MPMLTRWAWSALTRIEGEAVDEERGQVLRCQRRQWRASHQRDGEQHRLDRCTDRAELEE